MFCFSFLQINRDAKIGKISKEMETLQSVEIMTALKKLGETLTSEEESFLQTNSSSNLREFEQVSSNLGTV